MATVCAKHCTVKELEQMEATRKERPTKEIGGEKFEQARNEMESRRIAIDNWKAKLRAELSKPKLVEINGSAMEKYSDKDYIGSIKGENVAGKYYKNTINPNDFTEKYVDKPVDEPIDQSVKIIDSGNYEFQKTVGETQAEVIMFQELGMEIVDFDKSNTGFDNIGTYLCKDKNDCLVIIEAKCTQSSDGRRDLSTDTQELKEGSKPWVKDRLETMMDPESRLYSKDNAKFAEEALKKVVDGNLDCYLIHTNVNTLNIIVSKAHDDEKWQYHSAYRSVKK